MFSRRIRRRRDGLAGCRLDLSANERALLQSLPSEILTVLTQLNDVTEPLSGSSTLQIPPSLKRLFPRAYTQDDEAETAYAAAVRADLLEHHRHSLEALASSSDARELTEDQMNEWLAAINDMRLVLGTVLDVKEEDADAWPAHPSQQMVLYSYLSGLQSELIAYLSGYLPDPVPGADDTVPTDPWGDPIGGIRWDGTPQPPDRRS